MTKIPSDVLFAAAAGSGALGLGPVVDGRSVPHQTWEPTAPAEAKGIDFLVGNRKDEATLFALRDPSMFSLDWDSLKARITSSASAVIPANPPAPLIPSAVADEIIATYRKGYPAESPSDIYFRLSSDRAARANAIYQAEAQLVQAPGHVYMYHFDWNTPLADGKLRAFHTAELPLAMRLVCYPQSDKLSRQISGAWAAFARSGDPNHAGLPRWEPYSLKKRATMSFDVNNTRLEDDPAGTEMGLLKAYPGGLL